MAHKADIMPELIAAGGGQPEGAHTRDATNVQDRQTAKNLLEQVFVGQDLFAWHVVGIKFFVYDSWFVC